MVRLKDLCCGYGKKEIIHNINAEFEKNKITIIVGPNGCGKTTLLRAMAGLSGIRGGSIEIAGKDIKEYSRNSLAKTVTLMPQIRHVPNMVVEEILMCARYPYMGINQSPAKEDIEAVGNAMSITGITDYRGRNLKKLSGGERQKVYFAMAFSQETDIILFDEPTTYLDIKHQYEILELIKSLKEQGKTIIIVLHDIGHSLQYGDNIMVMESGKLIKTGNVREIYDSHILEKIYNVKIREVSVDEKTEYVITK